MPTARARTRFGLLVVIGFVGCQLVATGRDEPKPLALSKLTDVLGKGPDSKEMTALRKDLKGEPEIAKFDDCYFHSWKDRGVSLRFEKDAVKAVFLFADKADGFKEYRGELPEGLKFSDTRGDVEKKLGAAKESGGNGVISFWVTYPEKGLALTYASTDTKDKANAIHHFTLTRPKK
jgi:hypothetical protein